MTEIDSTTRSSPQIGDSSEDRDDMATAAAVISSSGSERCLREVLGLNDFGLALFSPINDELLPLRSNFGDHFALKGDDASESSPRDVFLGDRRQSISSFQSIDSSVCEAIEEEEDVGTCDIPVQLELPEDPSEFSYAPPILSRDMLQQVVDEALPSNLQMYTTWKRLFSINMHGDCVSTMLDRCQSFRHTLLVVRTSKGRVLGGFASEPWKFRAGSDKCSYYGTGASFLFSDFPEKTHGKLTFYKWVGANDYCQLCDTDAGRIALGGGGNFGLVIQDNFLKGSTGPCVTFDNPSLVPGIDGSFDIVEFEVYGIVPLMETVHFREQ